MTLPQGWADVAFEEITPPDAPIIYGILQPGPDLLDGVPYVRPTEIVRGKIDTANIRRTSPAIAKQYERASLKAGDTVLSIVGTIGKVAETPVELEGGNITQSSCRIRHDDSLLIAAYLRAFLRSPGAIAQFDDKRLGTAVPRLNIADIRQFGIPLPPLAEQRRIVAKLDTLTARLARARAELDRVPVLAEQLKRAGLKAAFCGELTADTREDDAQEPNFPPELDDQERGIWQSGQLPSSWEWVEFRAFFDDQTDSKRKLPEKEYEIEGAFPVIDQGKQQIGGYTSRSDLVHPASTPVIIFGDHTRCVKLVEPPFVQGADGVKVLAPSEDVDVRFARYALLAVEIPAKGYSRHMKFVRKTVWPLPPIGEQSAIVARLDAAFDRADRLEAEATRARALLDRLESALLAKAFRGELVPHDPNDEPAQTLLDRIRAQRAATPKAKRGRNAKVAA